MFEFKVKKIYKLVEDYQEIFINRASQTTVKYEELLKSKRTIHKDFYEDIFILESHKYYKIDFGYEEGLNQMREEYDNIFGEGACNKNKPRFRFVVSPKYQQSGLIPTIQDGFLYVYNGGENMVLIQDGSVVGEGDFSG